MAGCTSCTKSTPSNLSKGDSLSTVPAQPFLLSKDNALAWVRAICSYYYVPLAEKGKNIVFIEISSSQEAWTWESPNIKLETDFLKDMSVPNVRFEREEDFDSIVSNINIDNHVLRATFFPFAATVDTESRLVRVPVKNGDVMNWRYCVFTIKLDESGKWDVINFEYTTNWNVGQAENCEQPKGSIRTLLQKP